MTKPSYFRKVWPLLTALLLCYTAGTVLAQEQRWLLIFDTSANMKKRLPALDLEVTKLLLAVSGDHIQPGDSVGIWAFGENQLHAGQLPLITYEPAQAATICTNILRYVHSQTFKGDTSFDPLQPALSTVVQNSERLTIIIFCDGVGELEGTPYDYAVNQDMLAAVDGQKKLKQPVVIIVRSQHGKYVGATVNLPPQPSSVPEFPPLPPPPKPAPVVESQPVVKPTPSLPALIINGSTISTNPADIAAYVSKPHPVVTAPPPAPKPAEPAPAPAPAQATTTPPPPATPAPAAPAQVATSTPPQPAPAPTMAPVTVPAQPQVQPVPLPAPPPPAAAPAIAGAATPASGQNLDLSTKILLVVGGIFFGMALLLVIIVVTRRKPAPPSLITSIMTEDPNRPK